MQPNPCKYCNRDKNYNPFHDEEACMLNRIAELEAKLETAQKWDDIESARNEKLKTENKRLRDALEHAEECLVGYSKSDALKIIKRALNGED